jgi:hypothetical protein
MNLKLSLDDFKYLTMLLDRHSGFSSICAIFLNGGELKGEFAGCALSRFCGLRLEPLDVGRTPNSQFLLFLHNQFLFETDDSYPRVIYPTLAETKKCCE